eukprot:gene18520-26153_t
MSTLFVVDQRQYAIVFALGEVKQVIKEPGLHFKMPPPFQNVIFLDKRILTLDTPEPDRLITAEKKTLLVDAFVKWRIVEPRLYFASFGGDEGRARDRMYQIVKAALNDEITKRTVREVISGQRGKVMEAIRTKVIVEAKQIGVEIIDGIGSTEMLHIFLSNRPGDVRYGTTGKPVPGYEISLRGEDGSEVAQGEIGDLYIQGPSAALMYWNNRAKTRDTFQGGWTKAGDKYSRDADGYCTYAGRNDDMLKVSGIYVSPFEVEATLVQHPAVLEAAVIGKTDADGLTKTKAFVVLKSGAQATEAELQAFVKERLAPYKYPRFIEFLPELPKTAT